MRLFGWFRSDPRKEDMKKAADAYQRMQDRNIGVFHGLGDKSEHNVDFFDTYREVIKNYIDTFGKEDKDVKIRKLILAHLAKYPSDDLKKNTQDQSMDTPTTASSQQAPKKEETQASGQVQSTATKAPSDQSLSKEDTVKGKLKKFLENADLFSELNASEAEKLRDEKSIDQNARNGLRQIAQWMLRNCSKTGIFRRAKSADTRINFINTFVLKQPARIKLYAYYLIEKGKRKETDPEKISQNIVESQLGYVPNLDAFKNQMIATGFKFWKRFTGSEIYWNKLDEAFRIAVASKGELLPFGELGPVESPGTSSASSHTQEEAQQPQEKPSSQNQDNGSTTGQSDENEKSLEELNKQRKDKLSKFQKKAKDLIRQNGENKDDKITREQKLKVLSIDLLSAAKELIEIDNKIEKSGFITKMTISNAAEANMVSQVSDYIGMGGSGTNLAGKMLYQSGNNPDKFSWGLDRAAGSTLDTLETLKEAGNITSLVGTSISLVSLMINTVNAIYHGNTMTTGAKMMVATNLFADATAIAESMTHSIQLLKDTSEVTMNTTGTVLGVAAGGMNILSGYISKKNADQQIKMMENAQATFKNRQDAKDGQRISGKEAEKAINTAKLGHRIGSAKRTNAKYQMVAGGLQMLGGALSFTGIGAIGSVMGAAVNMYVYFKKLFQKSEIINQTIDDYIHMTEIYDEIVGKEDVAPDDKLKIERQLRIEVAARLGYSSKEGLFNAITVEYAKNLFNHVFYLKGNSSKKATAETCDKDYVSLLQGLHLEPDFVERKPKVNTIAYALQHL